MQKIIIWHFPKVWSLYLKNCSWRYPNTCTQMLAPHNQIYIPETASWNRLILFFARRQKYYEGAVCYKLLLACQLVLWLRQTADRMRFFTFILTRLRKRSELKSKYWLGYTYRWKWEYLFRTVFSVFLSKLICTWKIFTITYYYFTGVKLQPIQWVGAILAMLVIGSVNDCQYRNTGALACFSPPCEMLH